MAEHEKNTSSGRLVYILGIAALVICLVLIFLLVFFKHRSVTKELASRQAGIKAGTRVQVAVVTQAPRERTITLTGEARPYANITIYAKVSGYLKEIRVDKGDRVERGQLLARIDSPDAGT